VNKRFDDTIRISYTRTEIVDTVEQIRHELIREAMKLTGVTKGIEVTTMADIPAKGTGLGSSSSLTIGVLNALYAYTGKRVPTKQLAEEACKIEIDIVGEPIGKQDQYIAAYGGIKHFYFKPNEDVIVEPVLIGEKRLKKLEQNLMMFYTNVTRRSETILKEQRSKTKTNFNSLLMLKKLVPGIKQCLEKDTKSLDEFGHILYKSWEHKKKLASAITNSSIDRYYKKAIKAGAIGGKIIGAGGGGFLFLYCRKEKQPKVKKALSGLRHLPVSFEPEGSRIIYADE